MLAEPVNSMKRIYPVLACLLAGCATTGRARAVSSHPDLIVSIGEENVRVGDKTFAIGDAEAMRAGIAGGCAHGCRSIEIRAIPMARYDALLASYAAGVQNEAGGIQLRIAASSPVPMAVGEEGSQSSSCPAEVVLKRHAIQVYVNGEVLPPDLECDEWGATVCDSKTQDPMKRRELAALGKIVEQYRPRFQDRTCLYVESEMPAMLVDRLIATVRDAAQQRGTFSLRRDRRVGELRNERVTEALVAQGDSLTACYNAELEHPPTPQMEAVVRFLIGPTGDVLRVALRDKAMTTPRFEACLQDAVRLLKFPKPENGGTVEITYPLRFSPRPGLSDG